MRRGNLFWGFILIVVGGLFLLQTLGWLENVNIWGLIWPLFLICLGVWIVLGRFFVRSAETEHATIPLQGATHARVVLKHGAGRLNIHAGASVSDLAEGDFSGGLDLRIRRDGDLLDATLSMPSQSFPIFWGPVGYSLDWTIGFNREIPFSLELKMGAAEARVDLTDLKVTDVRLQTGASATDLKLPTHAGFTRLRVESGAASVNVHIPQGVAARIRARGGLAAISVDSNRFPRSGDFYQSSDYETAVNKAEIDIQTGVGAVDVR